MPETKELRALFSAQSKQLEESFRRISRETQKLQKRSAGLSSGVKKLAVGIGGLLIVRGVARAFSSALGKFSEFQKGMAEVATLTDFTTKEIRKMGDETLKMSRQFGQAIKPLTKARYDIVSAGFADIREQTLLLTAANKLAIAGVTDVSTATDLLTSVLNAYGLAAEDAEAVSDDLFTTVRLGKTTIPELSEALGKILPTAKGTGVGLKELSAALATTTASGINTKESVTALNALIFGLSAPASAAGKAFKKMGIETKNADGSMKKFNDVIKQFRGKTLEQIKELIPEREAAKAVLALANNYDKLNENVNEMAETTGAVQEGFETMTDTISFQLDKLKQGFETTFIEVFRGDAAPAVVEALKEMNAFFDENEQAINDAAKAIGDLAATGIKEGLIPAMALAIDSINQWNDLLQVGEDGTSRLSKEFQMFFADFKAGNDGILQGIGDMVDGWISGLSEMLGFSESTLDDIGINFRNAFDGYKKILSGFIDFVADQFLRMPRFLIGVLTTIKNAFVGAWKFIGDVIDRGAPVIWDGLTSAFDTIIQGIKNKFTAMVNFFVRKINSLISKANAIPGVSIGTVSTLARGGMVRGFQAGGAVGTDTVPAFLTPGEIVIPRKESQENKTPLMNLVQRGSFFAKGGMVPSYQSGGVVQGFQGGGETTTGPGGMAFGVKGEDIVAPFAADMAEFESQVLDFSNRIAEILISKMTEAEQLALERSQALMQIQMMPFSEEQAALMEGLVTDFYDLQAQAIEESDLEQAAQQRAQNVLKWSNFMAGGLERASQQILSGEKKFGVAFAQLGVEFLKEIIRVATAAIIAKKIEQIGIATIEAPGTFGASLAKIAPITAAAAVALGALSALGGAIGGGGGGGGGGVGAGGGGGAGFAPVTPGFAPEGAEAPGAGIIINVNVEGNVVDSEAFVEDIVAPVLAEAIERGTLAGAKINLVTESD